MVFESCRDVAGCSVMVASRCRDVAGCSVMVVSRCRDVAVVVRRSLADGVT